MTCPVCKQSTAPIPDKPTPDGCCPVCWHRHGRAVPVNCSGETISESVNATKQEVDR